MGLQVNGTSAERVNFNSQAVNYVVKDGKLVWADPRLTLSGPVGYTVVGSPTITDGVASGFSNDSCLRTVNSLLVGDNDSLEVVFKLNNEEISTTNRQDILNVYSDALRIYINASDKRVTGYYNKGDGNRLYISYSSSSEIINGYFKFLRKGDTVSFSHSSDNENWSNLFTSDAGFTGFNSTVYLGNRGYQHSTPINGSIDLNNTYIKVNGKLWFYGKNYASQNIAPVPAGYTFGTTTTPSIGYVDMRTQQFTAAPSGATIGRDN